MPPAGSVISVPRQDDGWGADAGVNTQVGGVVVLCVRPAGKASVSWPVVSAPSLVTVTV